MTSSLVRFLCGAAAACTLGLPALAQEAPARAPAASPAAAPADPLARLDRDVSVVVDKGDDPHILLFETEGDSARTRQLRVGDEYRDGWKLEALAPRAVTLAKDGVVRTVSLDGRQLEEKQAAPVQVAAAPARRTMAMPGPARGAGFPGMPPNMSPERMARLEKAMEGIEGEVEALLSNIDPAEIFGAMSPDDMATMMRLGMNQNPSPEDMAEMEAISLRMMENSPTLQSVTTLIDDRIRSTDPELAQWLDSQGMMPSSHPVTVSGSVSAGGLGTAP